MGLLQFVTRHLAGAILVVLGSAVAMGGYVLDAYSLLNMGFPPQIWEAAGVLLFFGVTVWMLYQFDQKLLVVEARLKKLEDVRVATGQGGQEASNQQLEYRKTVRNLGGMVRGFGEAIGQYGPLETRRYNRMRERIADSIHPVWMDEHINQLRRDMLHYADLTAATRVDDSRNDSKEVRERFAHAVDRLVLAIDAIANPPVIKP